MKIVAGGGERRAAEGHKGVRGVGLRERVVGGDVQPWIERLSRALQEREAQVTLGALIGGRGGDPLTKPLDLRDGRGDGDGRGRRGRGAWDRGGGGSSVPSGPQWLAVRWSARWT